MSIDGTFVERLAERLAKPETKKINGREVLALPDGSGFTLADLPMPDVLPAPLVVGTLTGLVDYLRANRDGLTLSDLVLHVLNEKTVALRSKLTADGFVQRAEYVRADCSVLCGEGFPFGKWLEADEFVTLLLSRFEDGGHRQQIVALFSNLRGGEVTISEDDGVSQTVTSKAGLVRPDKQPVPSPALLTPFRTFNELPQPQSPFIIRLREGQVQPQAALFECDGGRWRMQTVAAIADYLATVLRGEDPHAEAGDDAPAVPEHPPIDVQIIA